MREKQKNIDKWLPPSLLAVSIIILWEWLSRTGVLPELVFPAPSTIMRALINDYHQLLHHWLYTMQEALIGLFFGVVTAYFLAVVMDMVPWIRRACYPIIIVVQTIPTIAIAPIIVLWLGYDMLPKIILVALTTFFPIIINLLSGFAHCDRDGITLLRLMGANRWQILTHVKLPTSLTYFFSGLRVSVSYAFVGAVIAEWLGGFDGLGVYMIQTKKAFAYDRMFAVIVIISLTSLLMMRCVTSIERYCTPWRYHDKKRKKVI